MILLLLLLIFTVSCTNKEKPNLPANDKEDNVKPPDDSNNDNSTKAPDDTNKGENSEVNDELTAVYKGIYIYDGDNIFYITDDYDKLYCIKKDGSEKTLICEQESMVNMQIYENKLYVYSLNYEEDIPGKIVTMNKDGSDVKLLELDLEFSKQYNPSNFWIYKDFLFLQVEDMDAGADSMYAPADLYKYDLKNGSLTSMDKGLDGSVRPITYGDICYYYDYGNPDGNFEYNVLYKYNIYTDEKTTININKNPYSEKWISYLQIKDNFIYYKGKTYINRDDLDGESNTETIYENNDDYFYIAALKITDKYIFFVGKDDNPTGNIYDDKSKISIYRINHDGSELKVLFEETQLKTNIAPQSIDISNEDDNTLIYSNRIADTILFMDLDGKILNRD